MANNREPPALVLTTTTSAPTTQTTTTVTTIGGRRNRAPNTLNSSTTPVSPNHLNPATAAHPTSPSNEVEPFPTLASPSPAALEPSRTADYFAPPSPSPQFASNPRPIGIRRIPSYNAEQTSSRPRSGSGLTRRRTNTGPSSRDNPLAGLAALPGHYELGTSGGMEPIQEGRAVHHGQQRESIDSGDGPQRSGSTRMRRASNAARSMLSKLSDDPHEDERLRHANEYEGDVVDYLDVLGM